MQRFEPILKSWLIWLILAASAAGFAVLVLTDGGANDRSPAHPRGDHRLQRDPGLYLPQRSAPSSWSSAEASASVETGPSPRSSTRTETVRATMSSTAMLVPSSADRKSTRLNSSH